MRMKNGTLDKYTAKVTFYPVYNSGARCSSTSAFEKEPECCNMCDKLFVDVGCPAKEPVNKVTVVGAGQVGMACVLTMLAQNVTNDVALVDADAKKLEGEMLDLQHGATMMPNPKVKIRANTDYCVSAGSKVCVITAGARQNEGESRLALLQRNIDIFKSIIPNLLKSSPECVLVIVSNPVDIMTYVAWKISGLPVERVIGSGCALDSSRFRFFLSEKLGCSPSSVHGFVIGEHGDTSVPVWSGVNVAGVPLHTVNTDIGTENCPDDTRELHKKVVGSAYKVIQLKGYTSSAVGFTVTHLVKQILFNKRTVNSISTMVQDIHCIENEVFLSLPCVLGANGIERIVIQNLTETELSQLNKSAKTLWDIQKDLKI